MARSRPPLCPSDREGLNSLDPAGPNIVLTRAEQLALWRALNEPVVLTKAQRRLGALMRGELT